MRSNIKTTDYFLTSKRLGFREWSDRDFDFAIKLWGNPEVTKFIDARGKLTEKEVKTLLSNEIENQKNYGVQYWPIFLLDTHEFIGCCGLRPYDLANNVYEIGAHILPKHWRNGYALEAARTVIDFGFNTMKCSALFSGHNPNNTASKKLLEKLGFTYIRDEYYPPTGLNHPSYLLNKEDYVISKHGVQ